MSEIQRKRRPRRKKTKILWGRVIALSILFLLCVGGILWGAAALWDYGKGMLYPDERVIQEEPVKQVTKVEVKQKSLDKPIYMLLMGKDKQNPAQIDALYLLSINEEQQIIDIIGIPPNSKIISRDGETVESLNDLYVSGQVDLTKAVVADIFHIEIPYYALLSEKNFINIVDKGGSPDLYVEKTMVHYDENGEADINLRRGYQSLNGQEALQYMRYLDDSKSTLARVQRQERFMKLLLTYRQNQFTMSNMWRIYDFWDSVESNISSFDAASLVWNFRNIELKNIRYYILAGTDSVINGRTYWDIDPTEAQRLIGITLTGSNDGAVIQRENADNKENTEGKQ